MLFDKGVDKYTQNCNGATDPVLRLHILLEEEDRPNNDEDALEGVGDRVRERSDLVQRDEGGLVVQIVKQGRQGGPHEIVRLLIGQLEAARELTVSTRDLYTGLSDRPEIQWKQALPR